MNLYPHYKDKTTSWELKLNNKAVICIINFFSFQLEIGEIVVNGL